MSKYLKEIEDKQAKMDSLIMEYKNYCSFPTKLMGDLIAGVITTFEGEKYICQETSFSCKRNVNTVMDRMEVSVLKNGVVIMKESEAKENFGVFNFSFKEACRAGKIIILDSSETKLSDELNFKNFNYLDKQPSDKINYGNFDYIKGYVDFIIRDRIKNKTKKVNEESLKELTKEFYYLNRDYIVENYEKNRLLKEDEQKREFAQFEQKQTEELQKIFTKYYSLKENSWEN